MSKVKQKPTAEDILELSGIDVLHPGGFDLTRRIGEIVDMKGRKVLDVSCGRGTLTCYYAKNYKAKIVGIDINPEMIKSSIERAKKERVENLTEFKVADSLALPFKDNQFDVVINECAVGLTLNPQKCMDEMARVTKPGGYVVIHESTWLKEIPEKEKAYYAKRIGTVPYTLSEWEEMMKRAGVINLWKEDWSGQKKITRMRPDRKVKSFNDLFSPWEKISIIIPRVVSKYGIRGISDIYELTRELGTLYYDGLLGYCLIRSQKP